MSRDEGDPRESQEREPEPERRPEAERRPLQLPQCEIDRINALPPRERFNDPTHQRWAQSFRSRESLSEAGKKGYEATVRLYGEEFLYDRAADKRRAQDPPRSKPEHKVMRMLEELGQRPDRTDRQGPQGDYFREHKLAPKRHADFAWPEQRKAIEAWGGIHTARYPTGEEVIREQNARQVERAQRAGYELMILRDEDLTPERWEETRERVRRFLGIE